MSKNEEFIKELLNSEDYYEGVVYEIEKNIFDKGIENVKPHQVYEDGTFQEHFDCSDISLHPLQKIYVVNDTTSSYENGAFEFDYQFAFKYKGKYYHFISCGGN